MAGSSDFDPHAFGAGAAVLSTGLAATVVGGFVAGAGRARFRAQMLRAIDEQVRQERERANLVAALARTAALLEAAAADDDLERAMAETADAMEQDLDAL
jgi:hypothetical protein